jgi:hypothetical protein
MMSGAVQLLRRRAAALAALALVLAIYAFARLPGPSPSVRAALSSRFHFTRLDMPDIPGSQFKYVRQVHPSLRRISAWISAVGAGVALADLDGDGLSNDLCHVEPRTDEVIVSPVPGTRDRYRPFTLTPDPLPYDASTMAPMGCLAADLNEDGLMDLLVYYWGRTPVAFLRRTGKPGNAASISAADYLPAEIVPSGDRWFTNGLTLADLDGDGHIDILVGNYFQDGGHILDANGGGVEAMHNTKSKAYNGGHKHLLLWSGGSGGESPSVRFREVADVFEDQVSRGWTLGVGAADLDGDLLPEIYFAHDFGPDRLLHNRSTPGHPRFAVLEGKRGFTTPASFVLNQDSFKGMGVDFGDLNDDGMLDIYVSNIADRYSLNESHLLWLSTGQPERMRDGIAPYVQASEPLGLSRSGWGWDTRLDDFDNDGYLDAVQATGFIKGEINRWPELQSLGTGNDQLMTNPNYWPGFRVGDDVSGHNTPAFFVRDSSGVFQNIAADIGLGDSMVSRGIAVADVDGDGKLDFAFANQWEPSFVFHNDSPQAGRFLGLHVLLPLQAGQALRTRAGHPGPDLYGRPAIGAAAAVHLGSSRTLVAQVDGGSGHSGKRSPDLHFGLGDFPAGEKVTVDLRWRDPGGKIHAQSLQLTPGWHTVVLAWPDGRN